MNLIDRLVVSVVGDTAALKKSLADSKKQLSGFGAAVQKHSAAFMKTGAVMMGFAGAIGIAAVKVGKEFDKAYKKIRTGTGATGKVLEGLKKDFRAVVKDVPNSLDEVSTAIADLNTRLGLTGKPLQAMAKQMLNLARITETDVNAVIRTSTRLFGDWGVEVEDQAETLDYLYKVSQSTGVGIDRLSDLTTTYGVQLRTVGFTLEESLALMGKWEKEGVAAEKMLGGLSMALGKFAKAQKEPEEAMRRLMKQIEEAPTVGKAMELGVEALGTRAGPDFALAVREGRFAVEDFVAELADSSETINQAAEDTMTLTEKFDLLKNRAKLAIEPLAKKLMDELSPAIEKITDKLGDLDEEQLDNIASSVLWAAKILAVSGAILVVLPKIYQLRTAMIALRGTMLGAASVYTAVAAAMLGIGQVGDWAADKINNYYLASLARAALPHAYFVHQTKSMIEVIKGLQDNTLTWSEYIRMNGREIDEWADSHRKATKAVEEGTGFIWEYSGAIVQSTVSSIKAKIAHQNNEAVLESLMEQHNLTREAAIEYAKAEGLLKDETEDTTEAIDDQTESVDDLRSSFNDLIGDIFDGITTYNDFEESQIAVKEAQEKLTEAINKYGKESDEAIKASNNLDDAIINLIKDSFDLSTSIYATTEQQEEARKKAVELGLEYVKTKDISIEQFTEMARGFGLSGQDIIRYAEDMGIKLDEATKRRIIEVDVDASQVPGVVQRVLDDMAKLKDKTLYVKTYYETYRAQYAKGGIAGFAGGGIASSDGFSLPLLTAAKGLITLPQADEGMLAVLHPPELVLNPDQALRVLWKIANEPMGEKGTTSYGDIHIHNEYNEELASKTFARLFAQYVGEVNR